MVGNLISRAGNGPVLFLGLAGAIFGGNLLRAGDGGGVALAIGVALLGMGGTAWPSSVVRTAVWSCTALGPVRAVATRRRTTWTELGFEVQTARLWSC